MVGRLSHGQWRTGIRISSSCYNPSALSNLNLLPTTFIHSRWYILPPSRQESSISLKSLFFNTFLCRLHDCILTKLISSKSLVWSLTVINQTFLVRLMPSFLYARNKLKVYTGNWLCSRLYVDTWDGLLLRQSVGFLWSLHMEFSLVRLEIFCKLSLVLSSCCQPIAVLFNLSILCSITAENK
jgi:hypothetical protein